MRRYSIRGSGDRIAQVQGKAKQGEHAQLCVRTPVAWVTCFNCFSSLKACTKASVFAALVGTRIKCLIKTMMK